MGKMVNTLLYNNIYVYIHPVGEKEQCMSGSYGAWEISRNKLYFLK
jgi:hypothetical protein